MWLFRHRLQDGGSLPEIVDDGVTGFVVDTEEEAVEALRHIGSLDRTRIRKRFEERFTSTVMVKKYLDVYEDTIRQANALRVAKELERPNAIQEDPTFARVSATSPRTVMLHHSRALCPPTPPSIIAS